MTNFLLSRLMLHLKHIVTSTAKHDISHPDHFTDICWLASITSPMLYNTCLPKNLDFGPKFDEMISQPFPIYSESFIIA